MKQPLFFRIYRDGQLVEIKQFQSTQVIVGSNGESQINLKDSSVSPIHAMVEERESGFFVCDLGSSSGTFKNGKKILDEAIESGDEIKVGAYTVEFYVGVPKPKSKPPRAESAAPPVQAAAPSKPQVGKIPDKVPDKASPKKEESWKKIEPPVKTKSSGGRSLEVHEKVSGKTYAPSSTYKDLKQVIKPAKGTVVEVVVAWKERIVSTYHFSENKTIYVGSHPKNDIILPVFGSATVSHPLLKIDGAAKVFLTSDFRGELVQGEKSVTLADAQRKGRAESSGAGYFISLQQGELVRIDFAESISVYIRYVNQAPKPLAAPFFDLTTLEVSAVVGILIFGALLWLYMAIYQPTLVEEPKTEEPPRRAVFLYKPRIEPVDINQKESPPSDKAKLAEKKSSAQDKAQVKAPQKAASRDDEGKASEAKPNKSQSKEKKLTTPIAGKGTGIQKAAVAAKAKKNDAQGGQQKDVTKTGILSVLSGKGAQDKLSKVYSGAGVVGGLSQSATGSGAQSAAGSGETPGDGLKDIGKGGKGEATVGIAGVNTKGRGSGNQGYGTGSIGDKKNATVIPGGAEEAFTGTIDREAIRRVIIEHMREIKGCYERALNRDPGLHGKVVLSWVIGDRGRVRSAGVASTTMNSSEVEQCMASRLRTWIFPEPPAGQEAEVTYPFVFTAQQ